MKNFSLFFLLVSLAAPSLLYADESFNANTPVESERRSTNLVNLNEMRTASRTDELDRRLSELERDQRSQNDRIRNLERMVNDLQRRSSLR